MREKWHNIMFPLDSHDMSKHGEGLKDHTKSISSWPSWIPMEVDQCHQVHVHVSS